MTAPAPTRGTPIPNGRAILAVDFIAAPRIAPEPTKPCLSPQQQNLLELLADGLSNEHIAARLNTSRDAVHQQTKRLYERLCAHNRTHAVTCGFRAGLLS